MKHDHSPRQCSYCLHNTTLVSLEPKEGLKIITLDCPIHGKYTFIETFKAIWDFKPLSGRCLVCGEVLEPSDKWLSLHNADLRVGKAEEIYSCPNCGTDHVINLKWRI